jgi:hypothetical protein
MTIEEAQAPLPWTNPPLVLYHGTLAQHVPSILRGVDLSHARSRLDFGPGFYTTTSIEQAWALAGARSERLPGSPPAIVRFDVSRDELAALHCLWFIRGDAGADDFWTFVEHCRAGLVPHGAAAGGWYDLVAGPLSRNWRARRAYPDSDQVSFHTAAAVDLLRKSNGRRIR